MFRQSASIMVGALATALSFAAAAAGASTADHTKFKQLEGPFASGPDVTKACLECHTEAAKQVHRTKHWTWEFLNPDTKQRLGKRNVINNFCISPASNYAACASCHVGYGWKDESFDFSAEKNVDCLVCHDTTGNYKKPAGLAGHPAPTVDLAKVAQKIGKTSRDTCGTCHFFSGGGDGVKHGDLDSSLAAPEKPLDVHMDATGLDFSCGTCHYTSAHDVPGSRYNPVAMPKGEAQIRGGKAEAGAAATCQACHGSTPHKKEARLDTHASRIACQTCHIPSMARGGVATKMVWDWSTAGKLADGKPVVKKDDKGRIVYDSRKGDFVNAENVVPEYQWFNGTVNYTLRDEKIDPANGVLPINRFEGSPADGKSLIWPVKVFRGKQPFDPVNRTLVIAHTAGNDDTAYWKNFVWDKAIAAGQASVGLPFSGKFDFVATEMRWPIAHMVAPKDKALGCSDCHRLNGRLQAIAGVYIPGRDRSGLLDALGFGLAALALLGVLGHGAARIFLRRH
jgi:octaheme c-type cytochrome (tetrathionate reductase family)